MATVFRGIKSRVVGVVYGMVWLAVGVGGYLFVRENVFSGRINPTELAEWVPVVLVALATLLGLLHIVKALLQDDYRIIINIHRQELNVTFGHRLFN